MEEIHKKVWGSEEWIVNTDMYCGKILNLNKGYRCSMHYHKDKDETFYVLSGEVLIEVNGNPRIMKKGDVQRIVPGIKHRFTGLKKSRIIEFSTHHEKDDSYRETKSERVDLNEIKKELNI